MAQAHAILQHAPPTEQIQRRSYVVALRGTIRDYFKDFAKAEEYYNQAFQQSKDLPEARAIALYAYSGLMKIYIDQNRKDDIAVLMAAVGGNAKPEPNGSDDADKL